MLGASQRASLAVKVEQMYERVAEASTYLLSRGIDGRIAQAYRLGYVTPDIDSRLAGRVAIPYLTPAGPIDVKYRRMDDAKPKYLHETDAGTNLFNAQSLLHARDLALVCEGEFDAIIAEAVLGVPAVAYPGVSSWQDWWALCFDGIDRVLVVGDADDRDGQGATAAESIAAQIEQASVALMPPGYDVNSYYVRYGAAALAAAIGVELEEE